MERQIDNLTKLVEVLTKLEDVMKTHIEKEIELCAVVTDIVQYMKEEIDLSKEAEPENDEERLVLPESVQDFAGDTYIRYTSSTPTPSI